MAREMPTGRCHRENKVSAAAMIVAAISEIAAIALLQG
jgi:hypothetical protein